MKKFFVFILVLFLYAPFAEAANHYIRSGAAGTGTGADWTNAYTNIPSPLVRGDTYYIADGNYAGYYDFDDAVSGTTYITLKKATVSTHGTSTGWSDTYGDGQAVFAGRLRFLTSYVVFDGVYGGGPGNWSGTYGFKITETNDSISNILISTITGAAFSHIEVRHVDLQGKGSVSLQGGSQSNDAVMVAGGSSDLSFSYVWTHGTGRCPIFTYSNGDNILFEYWNVGSYFGSTAVHSALISSGQNQVGNMTFRYSLVTDIQSTGGLMWDNSHDHTKTLSVYGNVFYRASGVTWSGGNGIVGGWAGGGGEDCYGLRIYNNTFINVNILVFTNFMARAGDNIAYNNLFYNCNAPSYNNIATHDYNHYINSGGAQSEAHGTSTVSGDPFVNYAGLDFSLSYATTAGISLASPYNVSLLGVLRGEDGIWDRGANEYVAGGVISYTVTPSVGANGSVSPALAQIIQSGQTAQFSIVPNSGYVASVGGTCGGVLVGNTYTTNPVYASCSVVATFSQIATFVVTPYAGTGGTISPAVSQTVLSGGYQAVTTNASVGYVFASLSLSSGCTGYSSVGNIHSIGPVTGNCTVTANFAAMSVMDDGTAVHTLKPTGGGGKLGTGSGFVLK